VFQMTPSTNQPTDMNPLPARGFPSEDPCADFASESTMFRALVANDGISGFSFSTIDEFHEEMSFLQGRGFPVNLKLEIKCHARDLIDQELASCFDLNQTNIEAFLDALDEWDEEDKIKVIIAITGSIRIFNLGHDTPADTGVTVVGSVNFQDLAEELVHQGAVPGLSPEISPAYFDWDCLIRDISMDHLGVSESLCMRLSPRRFDGSSVEPFWV
jgi:hypothetical protein